LYKILIVENDEDVISSLINILKPEGYKIIVAPDGKSALKITKLEKPNVIISDIMMRDTDGFKLLSEIRNNHLLVSIPFIFVTAKKERSFYRLAMEKGADDYLTKPFTKKELLNAVSSRIKRIDSIKNFHSFLSEQKRLSHAIPQDKSDESDNDKLVLEDHLLIDSDEKHNLIKVKAIKMITAVGDYSKIITFDNNKYFFRRTMKGWEEILPDKNFIRIHRSTIINLDFVDKLERTNARRFNVYLNNESKPISMSRRYGLKFKDRFSY